MKHRKKLHIVLFCLISLVLLSFVKANDMSNEKLLDQLTSALNVFANKHGLSDAQIESLLGEIVLHGKKMKKGGVGVIDKDLFVVLSEKRNAVVMGGQKWLGKKSDKNEVLLTDGKRVFSPEDNIDTAHLKIIVFSSTEVRYIDLSKNTGGAYSR